MLSPLLTSLSPRHVNFPIVGRMVYTDQEVPPFPLKGLILIYQTRRWEFNTDIALKFKDSGLKALVVQMLSETYYPGFGEIVLTYPLHPNVPFPIFEITVQQTRELTGWFKNQTNRGVIVSFDKIEENPWMYYIETVWPIGGWFLLFSSVLVLFVSVYKLTVMILHTGPQVSVGQIVLVLLIFAMLIRLVWCMFDPFGAYRNSHFAWIMLGLSLPFAVIMTTTLLIALYWHEMIKLTGKQIFIFLDKLLIPFLIFGALLFIFEFVTALLRGLRYFSFGLLIATSSVYASISGIILVIFIVEKVRITAVFKNISKRVNNKRKRRFDRAFFLVLAIGAVFVLWLPPIVFIAAVKWFWHPAAYTASWFVILFGINIVAFLQAQLIRAPHRPWKWILCGLFMDDPGSLLQSGAGTTSKIVSWYSNTDSKNSAMQSVDNESAVTSSGEADGKEVEAK